MTYIYAWGSRLKAWPAGSTLRQLDRKGQLCEIVARMKMNSALVCFADGYEAVVSRSALRRAAPASLEACDWAGVAAALQAQPPR